MNTWTTLTLDWPSDGHHVPFSPLVSNMPLLLRPRSLTVHIPTGNLHHTYRHPESIDYPIVPDTFPMGASTSELFLGEQFVHPLGLTQMVGVPEFLWPDWLYSQIEQVIASDPYRMRKRKGISIWLWGDAKLSLLPEKHGEGEWFLRQKMKLTGRYESILSMTCVLQGDNASLSSVSISLSGAAYSSPNRFFELADVTDRVAWLRDFSSGNVAAFRTWLKSVVAAYGELTPTWGVDVPRQYGEELITMFEDVLGPPL